MTYAEVIFVSSPYLRLAQGTSPVLGRLLHELLSHGSSRYVIDTGRQTTFGALRAYLLSVSGGTAACSWCLQNGAPGVPTTCMYG